MCMTKKELESKVQEFRSLKAMKEELENELKAVEHSIIEYMTENELDTEITDTGKNHLQATEPHDIRQREVDRNFRRGLETV